MRLVSNKLESNVANGGMTCKIISVSTIKVSTKFLFGKECKGF